MKARAFLAVMVLALAACTAPTEDGTDTGTGGGTGTGTGTGTGDTGTGTGTGTETGGGSADQRVGNIGQAGIACDAYAGALGLLAARHDQGTLDAAPMADAIVVVVAVAPRCEDPVPPTVAGERLVRLQIAANAALGLTEGREMTVLELSATDSPFLLAENDERLAADIEPLPMPAEAPAATRQALFNAATIGSPHWAAYQSVPPAVTLEQAAQHWADVNQRARTARLAWESSLE